MRASARHFDVFVTQADDGKNRTTTVGFYDWIDARIQAVC